MRGPSPTEYGANIESKGITVSSSQEQLILGGHALNAVDAEQAVAIAKAAAPELQLVNLIKVAGAQQVLLKVRFIEASRSAERDLGVELVREATQREGSAQVWAPSLRLIQLTVPPEPPQPTSSCRCFRAREILRAVRRRPSPSASPIWPARA